jgi:endonuclease/exonuclease/phosphatase family metal-dependent hydrolase
LHQCIGTDKKCDPQRVAEVIRETRADVVGLQEVDFNPWGEKQSHQLDYLAEITGMQAIAGPTIWRTEAEFGNGLLTRRQIEKVRLHDVSVSQRQPRGVIDAAVLCEGKRIRVLVTHLGLALNERRRQAQSLLRILREDDGTHDFTVVLGDINEWRPRGFATYRLDTYLGKAPSPRTFPSYFPVFALDRIWMTPKPSFLQIRAVNHDLARVASDHLPVMATADLGASA